MLAEARIAVIRAGPAGRGFWVSTRRRVPCPRRGISPFEAGCSLGISLPGHSNRDLRQISPAIRSHAWLPRTVTGFGACATASQSITAWPHPTATASKGRALRAGWASCDSPHRVLCTESVPSHASGACTGLCVHLTQQPALPPGRLRSLGKQRSTGAARKPSEVPSH